MPSAAKPNKTNSYQRWVLAGMLLLLVGFTVWQLRRDKDQGPVTISIDGRAMGTTYNVKVVWKDAKVPPGQDAKLKALIDKTIKRIDDLMSTYRPDTLLSRFNASTVNDKPMPLDGHAATLFELAHRVYQQSDGAYDVSVGPLVAAWGFGAGAQGKGSEPDDATLATSMQSVGLDKVEFGRGFQSVVKKHEGVRLDFSGLAKGYAVDLVAGVLQEEGLSRYLIEIGGEMKGGGTRGDGSPWQVGIETPDPNSRAVFQTLPLVDLAMATSGDYRQFREDKAGRRIHHIIDPRTGRSATHALASATVLHVSSTMADAFATAIMVLGPVDGMALAERNQLPVLLIVRDPLVRGGFVARQSPQMDSYLRALAGKAVSAEKEKS